MGTRPNYQDKSGLQRGSILFSVQEDGRYGVRLALLW